MADHSRTLRPGEAQFRRMWFCARMLGLSVVLIFLTAILVGLLLPSVWQAVFVPGWIGIILLLLVLFAVFCLRGAWFRLKARHYGAVLKVRTEAEYNPLG